VSQPAAQAPGFVIRYMEHDHCHTSHCQIGIEVWSSNPVRKPGCNLDGTARILLPDLMTWLSVLFRLRSLKLLSNTITGPNKAD